MKNFLTDRYLLGLQVGTWLIALVAAVVLALLHGFWWGIAVLVIGLPLAYAKAHRDR